MRVLIADDNVDNRDLLERRIVRKGWQAITAADGNEAVARCQSEKPDLVLMDVAMPVMSGLEACRILRTRPDTAAIKIIAVTAHAMDASRAECMEAGCDGFATKPIDFAALFTMIDEVCGLGGAGAVA